MVFRQSSSRPNLVWVEVGSVFEGVVTYRAFPHSIHNFHCWDTCEHWCHILGSHGVIWFQLQSPNLVPKSMEFWTWWGVFPTKGSKMVATCLVMLYVARLILLTMGLMRGAPSLWILGDHTCVGWFFQDTSDVIVVYQWFRLSVIVVSSLWPSFCIFVDVDVTEKCSNFWRGSLLCSGHWCIFLCPQVG